LIHEEIGDDKALYAGSDLFIFSRRTSKYFDIRRIDGTVVHRSASKRSIRFLEPSGHYITDGTSVPPF